MDLKIVAYTLSYLTPMEDPTRWMMVSEALGLRVYCAGPSEA